jgi:hypothetical protein
MKCYIHINMDNAAFDDGKGGAYELARILHNLCLRLMNQGGLDEEPLFTLHDINGNTVGTCEIKGE